VAEELRSAAETVASAARVFRFAEDDSRFTTEICERYAERYGSTLANCTGNDDRQAEAIGEMNWEFLRETWGIEV